VKLENLSYHYLRAVRERCANQGSGTAAISSFIEECTWIQNLSRSWIIMAFI